MCRWRYLRAMKRKQPRFGNGGRVFQPVVKITVDGCVRARLLPKEIMSKDAHATSKIALWRGPPWHAEVTRTLAGSVAVFIICVHPRMRGSLTYAHPGGSAPHSQLGLPMRYPAVERVWEGMSQAFLGAPVHVSAGRPPWRPDHKQIVWRILHGLAELHRQSDRHARLVLHEFLRGANRGACITRLLDHCLDLGLMHRVCQMLTVPCEKIIDPVHCRDGDVKRIGRCRFGDRAGSDQPPRE